MRLRLELEAGWAGLVRVRPSLRGLGVPPGGPFDDGAARGGALLLGERDPGAVIELAAARAVLVVEEAGVLALTGAGHTVSGAAGPVLLGAAVEVPAGERLEVLPTRPGLRLTVVAPEGWSEEGGAYRANGLGRAIGPGRLALEALSSPTELWVVGPGVGSEVEARVSPWLDRVGVRFEGVEGPLPAFVESATRPSLPGALQLTPDGGLIVHGPDGPTLTGYPVLGFCTRTALDRLAQLGPGDRVRFVPTTLEQARAQAAEREARFERAERALALVRSGR